ncbi:hypothetical protein UFOVP71_196 [uncultured Caudovirales phage]|uniref:Uncharacterized protein n=1 Tax=uncultured Caudovirales phage TaxID=2100421 RepID=A0A6J5T9P3_9CAUD|nr:hypothetical protein UFOVP71_196 [uncultured Caudovirales phage]
MKSVYVLSLEQIKGSNPTPEYLDLIIDTFKELYTKENDTIVIVQHPTGYGQHLREAFADTSVGEVIIAPADMCKPGIVDELRQYAEENDLALVGKIIHPVVATDYFQIDPSLVYVNFRNIRTLNSLDWGDQFDATSVDHDIHLNQPTVSNGVYVYNSTDVANTTITRNGWILFNSILGNCARIGQMPDHIVPHRVKYYDSLVKNITNIYTAEITDQLDDDQRKYFSVSKSTILKKWSQRLTGLLNVDNLQSGFIDSNCYVENFYMVVDYSFSGLLTLSMLNKDDDTRLVFIHQTIEDEEAVKYILANWTGINTEEVSSNQLVKEQLTQFYSKFLPTDFVTFWEYCKSRYNVHYQVRDSELLDDLGSQCHANNAVFVANQFGHPTMLKATNLRLAATEFHCILPDNSSRIIKVGTQCYVKNIYKQFRMTFRNTQTSDTKMIRWNLKDNLLSQKWARCNQYDYLEKDCLAEKNYMLQHWEYDPGNPNARNIPALCAEMNRYVNIINSYFDGSSDKRVDYHITQYFDPVTLDQNVLNEIHHHFEILIGQVWNISDYFKKADRPTSFAIRQLNNLCHEMESLRRDSIAKNPKYWGAYIYFPILPGYSYKFVGSDYDHFVRDRNFGDLFLHYAQLGKTPLEAWYGKDDEIFDENITGLRYLSGEFVVNFGGDISAEEQSRIIAANDKEFFPWLRARGQDPESKFTGVGSVLVGTFERNDYPGKTANEIMLELFGYDDIYKIELIDKSDTVVAQMTMDYTWKDVLAKTDPTRMP